MKKNNEKNSDFYCELKSLNLPGQEIQVTQAVLISESTKAHALHSLFLI